MIVGPGAKGSSFKKLQRLLGVAVDGVVGKNTVNALQRRLGMVETYPATISLTVEQQALLGLIDAPVTKSLPPEATWPYGIDISGWQDKHEVDWAKVGTVANKPVEFGWVKISQGDDYVSGDSKWQIQGLVAKQILVGGYHFIDMSVSPEKNARHFFEVHRERFGDMPVLPPAADFEWKNGPGGETDTAHNRVKGPAAVKWIKAYDAEWSRLTCTPDCTYTGVNWWNGTVKIDIAERSSKMLWLARHRAILDSKLPKGWTKANFWQFTAKGKVAGFSDGLDVNRFLGTPAELHGLVKPVIAR